MVEAGCGGWGSGGEGTNMKRAGCRSNPTQLTRWTLSGGGQVMEGEAEGVPGWEIGQEPERLGGQLAMETAGHFLGADNDKWGQGVLTSDQTLAVIKGRPKVEPIASI